MNSVINKAALKTTMQNNEYFEAAYAILSAEVKKYGAIGGMQNGRTYDESHGHTVYCVAWTDKELVYTRLGKMKQVNHTVHSIRVYWQDQYGRTVTLFENYTTDTYGSIRKDRKTEIER